MAEDHGHLLDVAAADQVEVLPELNVETGAQEGVVAEAGVAQIALDNDEDFPEAGGVEAGELVSPAASGALGL